MYSKKTIWTLLILVVTGLYGLRFGYYKYLQHKDKSDRPWAYEDANGHSLTGLWTGEVKDPDGVKHQLSITITNPYDDEYRSKRANSKRIKRDRSSKSSFTVNIEEIYKGNTIVHENSGSLSDPEGNQISLRFGPKDDQHYHGFNLNLADGIWKGNELNLDVTFAFFTKEGYSHSDSSDPRHDMKGKLVMKKK